MENIKTKPDQAEIRSDQNRFSELEKTRMEHPPEKRELNGSEGKTDDDTSDISVQNSGIKSSG